MFRSGSPSVLRRKPKCQHTARIQRELGTLPFLALYSQFTTHKYFKLSKKKCLFYLLDSGDFPFPWWKVYYMVLRYFNIAVFRNMDCTQWAPVSIMERIICIHRIRASQSWEKLLQYFSFHSSCPYILINVKESLQLLT